ncbi:hypothetical protein BH23CHL10_BH23CHL10_10810 [soil metagenome]
MPIEPRAIETLFADLTASDVRWLQLRDGPDEVAIAPMEIDLLVDPKDLASAEAVIGRHDYRRQVAPGRGPHRFYVVYLAEDDTWVKLDIVTRIVFGRHQEIVTSAAHGVIERSATVGGIRMPAPADAYSLLMLHHLLDGSPGRDRHRSRLASLAPIERAHDPRPGWGLSSALIDRLDAAVAARAWLDLEGLAPVLARELAGGAAHVAVRRTTNRAIRALARRVPLPGAGGGSIALLGPDGSGKSTLAGSLTATLPFHVETRYLGAYGAGLAPVGRRFGPALAGRLLALSMRWTSGWLHASRGGVTLYDRHPVEAQMAPRARGRRTRLRRWLLAHAAPHPGRYLILDAPAAVLRGRKAEHELAIVEQHRSGYLEIARRLPRAIVIDAGEPPDRVRRRATLEVWRLVRRRMVRL